MKLSAFAVAVVTAIAVCSDPATGANVTDVPKLSDLRTFNVNSSQSVVNVQGYSTVDDGGGGTFVRNGTSCSDDDGVVVKEDHTHNDWCWYRQFSGPVHLPWYGAADATLPACYTGGFSSTCDSKSKLTAALAAAAVTAHLGGDGGVVTDGRSVYIDGNIDIFPINIFPAVDRLGPRAIKVQ